VSRSGPISVLVRARIGRRVALVGRASTHARDAGFAAVRLRLSEVGRRALSVRRRLSVTVQVRFAGNPEGATMKLRLVRPDNDGR
jgi:hypothetical protein